MKINDSKSFQIRFTCELCRYEQIAFVSVKPIKFNLALGAKFICNECELKILSEQHEFMDGKYNEYQ